MHSKVCSESTILICHTTVDAAFVSVQVASQLSVPQLYSRSRLAQAQRPLITRISPSSGPTQGGNVVTLTGNYFGDLNEVEVGTFNDENPGWIRVEVNETQAQSFLTQNEGEDTIKFFMPQGHGHVQVRVNAQKAFKTAPITYKYRDPTIDSVTPLVGPTCGHSCPYAPNATVLTLTGTNFGLSKLAASTVAAGLVDRVG